MPAALRILQTPVSVTMARSCSCTRQQSSGSAPITVNKASGGARQLANRPNHPAYPARAPVGQPAAWAAFDPGYHPVDFTHGAVLANDRTVKAGGWADPADFASINFSERVSYEGRLSLSAGGAPQNPHGRTGMSGRGLLGKWGPNHAADPIVTRYDPATGSLQVVLITRGDTGELAIPGGMVDAGEAVSQTLAREFNEEATSGCRPADLERLFNQQGDAQQIVYRGIVDDPRNTDNAWMETTACHFHCDTEMGALLPLTAGDDAVHVRWQTIPEDDATFTEIYASHRSMILAAVSTMPRSLPLPLPAAPDPAKSMFSQGARSTSL
jgi:ADP-ribose pyrophosphatase